MGSVLDVWKTLPKIKQDYQRKTITKEVATQRLKELRYSTSRISELLESWSNQKLGATPYRRYR